jgi:ketosteroid isomerase-like protein
MIRLCPVIPLFFGLFMCGCSHSAFDLTAEKTKLLQRDAEWSQASSEGKDLEKIISYWSDDAKVIEPGQPIYQGKDAIRKYVSDSLKTPGFKIHWTSEDPVFSPDGKMAYMYGIVEITMPDPKAGLVTVHARGLTIWRHESDGEWRCVLDMSNEAPPAT